MTMTRRMMLGYTVAFGLLLGLTGIPAAQALTPEEAAALPDRFLGKADAPVTIIEYASLSCGHCAHFQETTLPELKEKFIDTGKVKLIYRDYPTDGPALKAAAVARCMPEGSYHAYLSILFKNQRGWYAEEDPAHALAQYARLGGLSQADAEACANSTKLQDAIADGRLKADSMYGVRATPTFIINDGKDKIEGALPFTDFAARINALLPAAPATANKVEAKPDAAKPVDDKAEKKVDPKPAPKTEEKPKPEGKK